MSTTTELQGINFMTKSQFDSQSSLSQNQVYAVEGQFVIETYVNGTSWYRVYSDSWCEQGGLVNNISRTVDVNLLKSYKDTNYTVNTTLTQCATDWSATVNNGVVSNSKTTTKFILMIWFNNANTQGPNDWIARGYIN